jgi:uncharacterized phage protein gp47/JayE
VATDILNYVQLDLVDRDPQDVFDIAQQYMKTQFPELNLREGMMETVLLEAVALEVAESIFAINRLPDGMTEVLLSLFGVDRDPGQPPVADITFSTSSSQGVSIPAGSSFVLDSGTGLDPLVFITDGECVIPEGQFTGVISATATTYTDIYNGVPAGAILTAQDSLLYLDYATLSSSVNGGRDPETDEEYLSRGVQSLQRLSSTLVLPKQFVAAALEQPYIGRAKAIDLYNPDLDPDGNGPVGNEPGYMTVAVYGNNEFVSPVNKDELLLELETESQANLMVKLIDPLVTPVTVDVTVAYDQTADAASVVEAVTQSLLDYLNPMNWTWGDKVRRSSLISLITNIEGVDYVEELTTPASDITLTGVANLVSIDIEDIIVQTI